MPPSEDALPRPTPKLVWQKGETKWHVDAPVCVAGDRVLVATSLLEKEKVGERALYALNAATGETAWRADLPLNPWGGASVSPDGAVAVKEHGLLFSLANVEGDAGYVDHIRITYVRKVLS